MVKMNISKKIKGQKKTKVMKNHNQRVPWDFVM